MLSATTAPSRVPLALTTAAVLIIPLNYGVWWLAADGRSRDASTSSALLAVFLGLAFVQLATGAGALVSAIAGRKAGTPPSIVVAALLGALAAAAAPLGALVGWAALKLP